MSDHDRGAEGARRLLAKAGAAPIAGAPRSSPALSAPPAPMSDHDRGAEGARRLLAKIAHPVPPAPDAIAATSWLTDYEKGAAATRKLLGKTA